MIDWRMWAIGAFIALSIILGIRKGRHERQKILEFDDQSAEYFKFRVADWIGQRIAKRGTKLGWDTVKYTPIDKWRTELVLKRRDEFAATPQELMLKLQRGGFSPRPLKPEPYLDETEQ